MDKIKAVITGGENQFRVYIEGTTICSSGDCISDMENNLQESIGLYENSGGVLPESMKGKYEIEYIFDISGFLAYYLMMIDIDTMMYITLVDKEILLEYSKCRRKPNKTTAKRIIDRVHKFGRELQQIQIIG